MIGQAIEILDGLKKVTFSVGFPTKKNYVFWFVLVE